MSVPSRREHRKYGRINGSAKCGGASASHDVCHGNECKEVCGAAQAFMQSPSERNKIRLLLAIAETMNENISIEELLYVRNATHRRTNGIRERLLGLAEVEEKIGLKKTAIYGFMAENKFPMPLKIGRLSRWREADVDEWITHQRISNG